MQYQYPYNPITDAQDSKLVWTNGNPAIGANGSVPAYQTWVNPMTEILNVIQNAGLTPTDADLSQLWEAINKLIATAINNIHIPTPPTYSGTNGVSLAGTVASLDIASLGQTGSCTTADYMPILRNGIDERIAVQDLATEILSLAQNTIVKVPNLVIFSTSGTYTPTAGARLAAVRGVGAGGSGATSSQSTGINGGVGIGGGGGAGGGFSFTLSLTTNTQSVPVTIGAGGISPAANQGLHGNQGGSTLFGNYASATGGVGGFSGASFYNDVSRGAGGLGGVGTLASGLNGFALNGQPGANAGDVDCGSGGNSMFGAGGIGGDDIHNQAGSGGAGGNGGKGAGGGGCDHPGNGGDPIPIAGNGGDGFIEIWEYF